MSSATGVAEDVIERESTDRLVRQIHQLVRRNSSRWKLLSVLEQLGLAVSALLAYLWIVFWLDNVLRFPLAGRIAASLGLVAGLVTLAIHGVRRWRRLLLTDDRVALAIERRTPSGVQNRLINALQIVRSASGHPTDLSRAVIEENVSRIQAIQLQRAAALRPAVLRLTAAALLVIVGFAFYFLQPARFGNAASRIFLPFGDIEPLYRTTLFVKPGDVEAEGEVGLRIEIRGVRPDQLVLLEDIDGKRRSELIPVPAGTDPVHYTLRGVEKSMQYAVRGGDFTTRFYRITVPRSSHLELLKCVYRFPTYTGLPEKRSQSGSGEIEALYGTRVDFELDLDEPCESATLLVERAAALGENPGPVAPLERIVLKSLDARRFAGSMTLEDQASYRIETRQAKGEPYASAPYAIHVLPDEDPKLELTGLEETNEAAVDASLSLRASATDDFGLGQVELCYRRLDPRDGEVSPHAPSAGAPAPASPAASGGEWRPIQQWKAAGKLRWSESYELSLLTLEVAEGDVIQIALRGNDNDPRKAGRWAEGTNYRLKVGGDSAALQLQYEQILRSEAELKQITLAQRNVLAQAVDWVRKLDGDGKLDWRQAKNIQALHAAMAEQAKEQAEVRQRAGQTARWMVAQAANVRFAVGMLADTEMVRAMRIYESVPTRDSVTDKRTALADLQLTLQRTLGSLQQLGEEYQRFRQDWELTHMVDFLQMLSDRQAALRDTSLQNADRKDDTLSELRRASSGRRQEKLQSLVGLSATAFNGLGTWLDELQSPLAGPYSKAADALAAEPLKRELTQSAEDARQGRWKSAAGHQDRAAKQLQAIHAALKAAQSTQAQQALDQLEELAKSDVEAQKELKKLHAGFAESPIKLPEKLSVKDIIHLQQMAAAAKRKGSSDPEQREGDDRQPESAVGKYARTAAPSNQQFDRLRLAASAGEKSPSFPNQSDRRGNTVVPPVQKQFEDLVGALLNEADEMADKYDTYNRNSAAHINEHGDVNKQSGFLNSTAASAATGNKKPPVNDIGGVSQVGRQGARAHGLVVGEEAPNMRGRDQVQEGMQQVPDQQGTMKETMTNDPQNDTATGIGGKKTDSKETRFSTHDVGKWTDDMADRLGKPQDKNTIVERQGGRLDPRIGEKFLDLTSDHEQIIERVKAIRKELKNLYLPTEHLDEILDELNGQLDRMKQRPGADLFREQRETLDKLRGTLRVFQEAQSGFQPSLPREQVVQGHVLDQADPPTTPGYEEAVKRYYEKMSASSRP